jgi:predicted MFS family arabinose efflux permease
VTADSRRLAPSLVALLACGAGLSAASLYYNQPILGMIARELGVTPKEVGLVPTFTQLGYASGLILFAPLGDKLDRRRVIVIKLLALGAALVAAGLARTIAVLSLASLAIGLLATAAQDFVPTAAALAPPEARGKTVGSVMTGLLLGILLSRLASGAVSERFGWRAMFFAAAATIVLLSIVSAVRLPKLLPSTSEGYVSLLASMVRLARTVAPLRGAALAQGLLSVTFSAFWSTLALALAAPPYHLGSTAIGAFGIAGAAGALIAPVAGAAADRRGPQFVIRAGAVLVALSFAAMTAWQGSLAVLIAATLIFDLGIQACLIAHQTIVYSLEPSARSRLNALLVSSMFLGMSAGSAAGSRARVRGGWTGVTVLGALAAGAALAVHFMVPPAAEQKGPYSP